MSFWKRLRNQLFAPPGPSANAPPPVAVRPRTAAPPQRIYPQYLPRTYAPAAPNDGASRANIFDPALKQFGHAFRPGDPSFPDEGTAVLWAMLRRRATDHVLRAIAESTFGDQLILRGSRLLKAWIGDAAREPGDLDWVVDPPTVDPDDAVGSDLCGQLISAVFAPPTPAGIRLVRNEIAIEDIWTYERARGRRVAIPWRAEGLPGGAVQVDVVFRETFPDPDRRLSIPAADGGCVSVRAATPAQSLAWKLAWLMTDMWPQGKDVYDAALLAEHVTVPTDILERTVRLTEERSTFRLPGTASAFVAGWGTDWKNFQTEYPWVEGGEAEWLARLTKALEPTFATPDANKAEEADRAPDLLDVAWRTPTVVQLAQCIDTGGDFGLLPILADALQDAGCDDEELLNHCRCAGPHARGCWVVDLILGKG